MSTIDWAVLILTLGGIIIYGVYKSRSSRNLEGYFLSNREMPWWIVLLSIMGTQASAVTFLSAPGQAYTDGMRFVQYYFGLPFAMVVLCITFVPIFHKLKLYTAYEFLEKRFDVKTRTYTSFLFLLSRALSTGISVYAPAIILSSLLGWNIYLTNIVMGGMLIIYTVTGGARAVAYTQQLQLIIVFIGLIIAGYMVVHFLPANVGFTDALLIGGKMGKFNVITTGISEKGFDWTDRFNIFSGVIGGFFLSLAYFGTDQSQVGRYLTAKSVRESRMGLLMNGIVKVPMQFLILLIGVLVFTFYQFNSAPVFFNDIPLSQLRESDKADSLKLLEDSYSSLSKEKQKLVADFVQQPNGSAESDRVTDQMLDIQEKQNSLREEVKQLVEKNVSKSESNDTNYIFIRFVLDHLPAGLVGLLIAIIFLAAWGSIAAALNSLASATVVDFHKKFINKNLTDEQDFRVSRWYTLLWGVFCVAVAIFVTGLGSLIEAVNVLGSWFYGVMLGIFLVAFYMKKIGGNAVFVAAIVGEIIVIGTYAFTDIGWLWLNVIGAVAVVFLAWILQVTIFASSKQGVKQI
ncbi:sodium:solute symporter [Pollutibacter soli]|uniref:sodium:solute symporter n=1 Tax=Pollutibacter soli TaxID=3034157 RepID=UPI00301410BC